MLHHVTILLQIGLTQYTESVLGQKKKKKAKNAELDI